MNKLTEQELLDMSEQGMERAERGIARCLKQQTYELVTSEWHSFYSSQMEYWKSSFIYWSNVSAHALRDMGIRFSGRQYKVRFPGKKYKSEGETTDE